MPSRSSITGEFVTKTYADKHKSTTQTEKPSKPSPTKPTPSKPKK